MDPHYAKAPFMKTKLLLFLHENFTHEKISHTFNLPSTFSQLLKCSSEKKHTYKKKTWKNFHDFLLPK